VIVGLDDLVLFATGICFISQVINDRLQNLSWMKSLLHSEIVNILLAISCLNIDLEICCSLLMWWHLFGLVTSIGEVVSCRMPDSHMGHL